MLDTIERRVQTDSPLDVTSEEFSRGNYNTIPTLKPAKRLGSGNLEMARNLSGVRGPGSGVRGPGSGHKAFAVNIK